MADEKYSPVERRKGSNASSTSHPSVSSFSSFGSSNDFGLPPRNDSGSNASDICNVEYALENNNSPENNETTLKRICETYKDSSRDVHTLEGYARIHFTPVNSNMEEWKKNEQSTCIWSYQTVNCICMHDIVYLK